MTLHKIVGDKVEFMPIDVMKKQGLYEEVKIRCRYCEIKDICHLRERKEKMEASGIVTKCALTPNRSKKKKAK